MADTPRIENRKARQYYEFLEFFEAGLVLTGPEVKSIRAGQVSFGDSFVECRDGEAFVVGMRNATLMPKLPELFKRVARLEKEMGHKPITVSKTDRSLVALWNRWLSMMHLKK